MPSSNERRSLFVAATVAAVLLAQTLVLAWSAGAMPLGPMHDQFGNPLCITSVDHGGPAQDHGKLPNCCVMGCATSTWSAAPSDDAAFFFIDLPDHLAADAPHADDGEKRPLSAPFGARAPPYLLI